MEKKEKESLREIRCWDLAGVSLRVLRRENELPKIEGYAAVFNSLSEDLGGFVEKIAPGAFTNTLKTADVRALLNHDSNFVLGRTTSGNLELKEDKHGLKMIVTPPDTQWARDLLVTIERGDINQMSFGFMTIEDSWKTNKEGPDERTLIEVGLVDVSPVTFPAYPDTEVELNTRVALRSLEKFKAAAPSSGEAAGTADPSIRLAMLEEEDELFEKLILRGDKE